MKTGKKIKIFRISFIAAVLMLVFSCKKEEITTLPEVTTIDAANITQTTALIGGVLLDDGGAIILEKGFLYGTDANLNNSSSKIIYNGEYMEYSVMIKELEPNTTYYYKAYALNSEGIAFGAEKNFTTLIEINSPLLSTKNVSGISQTSALSGGEIISDGGADIIKYGICWSTSPYPTILNSYVETNYFECSFDLEMSNLQPNTYYFVRAFAINEAGISYGDEVNFQTLPIISTVIDIDGNEYDVVTIGTQTWFADNLKTTKYRNGDLIPVDLSDADWGASSYGAMAIYPHSSINGLNSENEVLKAYGGLYNWYAVSDERGLCPVGWKVPNNADWTELINYVKESSGIENFAGNILKSCRQVSSPLGGECATSVHPRWDYHSNHFGSNDYGFSAITTGLRFESGTFFSIGISGFYWTSTESNSANAWRFSFGNAYSWIEHYAANKNRGFSVRCIKE